MRAAIDFAQSIPRTSAGAIDGGELPKLLRPAMLAMLDTDECAKEAYAAAGRD